MSYDPQPAIYHNKATTKAEWMMQTYEFSKLKDLSRKTI